MLNLFTASDSDIGMESMLRCAVDDFRRMQYEDIRAVINLWKSTKPLDLEYDGCIGVY